MKDKHFPESARGSSSGRPIMVLFDVLGKKWTLRILWELKDKTLNFRSLQACCDMLSPTVLNNRLKTLRELDLINHGADGYSLSVSGQELGEQLVTLDIWATQWQKKFK